jgi:3',5'-cyclic AMP phosphodiesterase CpdA
MKILHLSDLHVGISKHHNEKVEKIIKNIKNQDIDHLVITGDLTNSGSKEEFEMLADLLCRCDLHTENKLTVIPGNHDLYAPFFSEFLSFTSVVKNYKQALEFFKFHFSYNRKRYLSDLNKFNEYFKRSFTGTYTVEESICGYPFVKILEDRVALIGIDSNSLPSFLKNPGCSTGEITTKGLTALKKIFESQEVKNKIKIVLIHHYLHPTDTYIDTGISFRFIKLFNREVLVKLFDEYNVNLVLHGHFHVNNKYWLVDHKIMVLNGGATMNGQWHLINVNGEKISVQ